MHSLFTYDTLLIISLNRIFYNKCNSFVGTKYGILSIKTQIVHIVQNYHLSTNISELKKDQLAADLCVRSKIGYPIKFTKRQANVKRLK